MIAELRLEEEIEDLRSEMYHALEQEDRYEKILRISQKLDRALNELEKIEKC
ncbi:aspartyl-phosphate phosphatase Spo0E family protein [Halobacillus salinus]|uniref:Aspartyl-phosphate phosphatase Spo0E family protein n=1 Tax=Halobacillus salinus TaxID=192814 RepID=A0A4Z0H2X0_9BACI|nr:aspartyl-phosphate phosphatase Spo0E family protein [Halobacillus salinus]TGB04420.1 aspartyl-phosphate phosphatase Spo0E family protein [Halobacillus salinus]